MSASSRLERLLSLLHSGTDATRTAAARQLGQIQREHPQQLHGLMRRLLPFLFSSEWETRRAAALALECIASEVPEWKPAAAASLDAEREAAARSDAEGAWLAFGSFDMERVLQRGAPLLASGGQEFDLAPASGDGKREKPRDRLLRQRAFLQDQLGLGGAMGKAMGKEASAMGELLSERDVEDNAAAGGKRSARLPPADPAAAAAAQAVTAQLAESGDALSERARNAMRRKAKEAATGFQGQGKW